MATNVPRRFVLGVCLLALFCMGCRNESPEREPGGQQAPADAGQSWGPLHDIEAGYVVDLPGIPRAVVDDTLHGYEAGNGLTVFNVLWSTYPLTDPQATVLAAKAFSTAQTLQSPRIEQVQRLRIGNHNGIQVVAVGQTPDGAATKRMIVRLFLADGRLYQLFAVRDVSVEDPEAKRFFDTFAYREKRAALHGEPLVALTHEDFGVRILWPAEPEKTGDDDYGLQHGDARLLLIRRQLAEGQLRDGLDPLREVVLRDVATELGFEVVAGDDLPLGQVFLESDDARGLLRVNMLGGQAVLAFASWRTGEPPEEAVHFVESMHNMPGVAFAPRPDWAPFEDPAGRFTGLVPATAVQSTVPMALDGIVVETTRVRGTLLPSKSVVTLDFVAPPEGADSARVAEDLALRSLATAPGPDGLPATGTAPDAISGIRTPIDVPGGTGFEVALSGSNDRLRVLVHPSIAIAQHVHVVGGDRFAAAVFFRALELDAVLHWSRHQFPEFGLSAYLPGASTVDTSDEQVTLSPRSQLVGVLTVSDADPERVKDGAATLYAQVLGTVRGDASQVLSDIPVQVAGADGHRLVQGTEGEEDHWYVALSGQSMLVAALGFGALHPDAAQAVADIERVVSGLQFLDSGPAAGPGTWQHVEPVGFDVSFDVPVAPEVVRTSQNSGTGVRVDADVSGQPRVSLNVRVTPRPPQLDDAQILSLLSAPFDELDGLVSNTPMARGRASGQLRIYDMPVDGTLVHATIWLLIAPDVYVVVNAIADPDAPDASKEIIERFLDSFTID